VQWHHEKIVRLPAWPTKVEAPLYNLARRALARMGGEVRLPLRGLKTLDLVVQEDSWTIVDRSLDDKPVAAWTGFESAAERGLHEPVICELRYYHRNAGLVIKKTLRRMDEALQGLLKERDADDASRIVAIRPRVNGS
jgi:hypothetical protein